MTKHAAVLQKALPAVDLFAGRMPTLPGNRILGRLPHTELAVRIFEMAQHRSVVAFTSVHPGEGVTSTIHALAAELVQSSRRVAILDGGLHHMPAPAVGVHQPDIEDDEPAVGSPRPAAGPDAGQAFIAGLRSRYDCVLIDCGSMATSVDLLRLAPLSDGVVVVVEAGRTDKQDIDRAMQFIADAQGTLLGFVMNKRRYPIPNWLYRRL